MKKLFYSALFAAALTGCSNETEVVEPVVDPQPEVQPGGEGYVGFSIQLPTTPGTRANDDFNDGTPVPSEYEVYNATLFIFKGTSEADATYESAHKMNVTTFDKVSGNDQCTTQGIVSSKVTKPTLTGFQKLFAYVIINDNNLADIANNKLGETPYTTTTTFTDFSKIVLNEIGDESHGFVMTNAPVANYAGGASDPGASDPGAIVTTTTLSRLDENKIFTTEAAAQLTPAAEIYMERAAAKVTVALDPSMAADPGISADPSVKFDKATIKWTLSNVNSTYYNTRQMKNDWLHYVADGSDGAPNPATKYRFISGAAIHTGVYRTYWGEDVNYSDNTGLIPVPGTPDKKAEDGKSVYTCENTFNVKNQIVRNSTGIAVSAKFNGGESFYTANTYGANKILQVPGAGTTGEKIEEYIMTYLCNNITEFKTWYEEDASNRINVTMTNNADGTAVVNTITTTSANPLPSSTTPANVNSLIKFQYYAGGVAYYNVLIKHFGDAETPWTRENHSDNSVEGVYKTIGSTSLNDEQANNNYLGRYGVVRNNWYKIEITGIRQIGSPTISGPVGGGDPDDNVDNYLSVKIHITPWAVREQSVIL